MNDQPSPMTGTLIRTNLDDNGNPSVLFQITPADEPPVRFAFTPDAAAEISLLLLAASYAARAEQALFVIGKQKSLSVEDLIRWMRTGKE
jgi:hypothetical protein